MRKKIDVARVIELANTLNATSKGPAGYALRTGSNSLASTIMSECDVYAGFRYLAKDEVPAGELPGIIFDESPARAHEYPDATRISYYTSRKLNAYRVGPRG